MAGAVRVVVALLLVVLAAAVVAVLMPMLVGVCGRLLVAVAGAGPDQAASDQEGEGGDEGELHLE